MHSIKEPRTVQLISLNFNDEQPILNERNRSNRIFDF